MNNYNNYEIKQFINEIHHRKLSNKYIIIKFDNVENIDEKLFNNILNNFNDVDEALDVIFEDIDYANKNLFINYENLPKFLKNNGYILNNTSSYFFGRDSELIKMDIILNKNIKNNILIVGSPGVGKTSLVEQYCRIRNKRNIYLVNCSKLISGTEYRGSFEEKIMELMDYAQKYKLILFFDEIHTLINLGKTQGGISITDMLKPYLLINNLNFIGATTLKEANLLLCDEAFKRRFACIYLDEPNFETLINIKNNFEESIGIKNNSRIDANTTKYLIERLRIDLPNKLFPDKLIDFIDYFYSYCKVHCDLNNELIKILEDYIIEEQHI